MKLKRKSMQLRFAKSSVKKLPSRRSTTLTSIITKIIGLDESVFGRKAIKVFGIMFRYFRLLKIQDSRLQNICHIWYAPYGKSSESWLFSYRPSRWAFSLEFSHEGYPLCELIPWFHSILSSCNKYVLITMKSFVHS